MVNRKLHKTKDGLQDAKKVVQLLPNSHKGYLEAARLCVQASKHEKAREFFKQAQNMPDITLGTLTTIKYEIGQLDMISTHSPIKSLPTEILCDIFEQTFLTHNKDCLDSDPTTWQLGNHSYRLRPNPILTCSHVCHAWRSIITGSPSFWRIVRVNGEIDKNPIKKLQCWVSRSRPSNNSPSLPRKSQTVKYNGIQEIVFTNLLDFSSEKIKEMLDYLTEAQPANVMTRFTISAGILDTLLPAVVFQEGQILAIAKHLSHPNRRLFIEKIVISVPLTLNLPANRNRLLGYFPRLRVLELHALPKSTVPISLWKEIESQPEPEEALESLKRLVLPPLSQRLLPTQLESGNRNLVPNVTEINVPFPHPGIDLSHLKNIKYIAFNSRVFIPDTNIKPEEWRETVEFIEFVDCSEQLALMFDAVRLPYPSLTRLSLKYSRLTTSILSCIALSQNLEHLSLRFTRIAPADEIKQCPVYPRVKILDLSFIGWLNGSFLESMAENVPSLEYLRLDGNEVSAHGLGEIVQKRSNGIKELSLKKVLGLPLETVNWIRDVVGKQNVIYAPQT